MTEPVWSPTSAKINPSPGSMTATDCLPQQIMADAVKVGLIAAEQEREAELIENTRMTVIFRVKNQTVSVCR